MIRFAVLDHDTNYSACLVNFFSMRYSGQADPALFDSKEALKEAIQNVRMDIILVSPSMLPNPSELETKAAIVYLVDEKDVEQLNGCPAIFRYQRGEIILRQLKAIQAQQNMQNATYSTNGGGTILCFAGAGGGSGCSTAAMGCAAAMARKGRKAIYLCLQNNGFVADCLHGEGSGDLSRALYEVKTHLNERERAGNMASKLEGMLKYEVSLRFHYLDTFRLPLEAESMNAEEVELLLNALASVCDVLVVDMDGAFNPVMRAVLKLSARIILVSDGNETMNQRLDRMVESFSILDESEDLRLLHRTHILYNRFGSRSTQAQLSHKVSVLGEINKFSGSDRRGILEELAKRDLYQPLLES